MGCASSTPMIATAGSDMLKAATHVADDAAKTAEQAVQGAAHTVGETVHKTLDTAKETVGTAVTGIAHDLEAAYVEKSEALDEVKNNLLQKLHLGAGGGGVGGAKEAIAEAPAAEDAGHSHVATPTHAAKESATATAAAAAVAASAAVAAAATQDADSLKTTTPEPEIENVLAKYNEEKPPTPKPTLAELGALSDADAAAAAAEAVTAAAATAATAATIATSNSEPTTAVTAGGGADIEQRRPNTTEWEEYADTLSRARRLRPHEVYGRKTKVPGAGVTTGGPISLRRFGPLTGAPPPPPPPPPWPSKYKAKEVPQHHQHLFEDDSSWSDLNYNNSSTLGTSSRSGGVRGRRGRLPYPLPRPKYGLAARRYQRDFNALLSGNGFMGGGGRGGGFAIGAGGGGFGHGWRTDPLRQTLQLPGRAFDYNPSRVRLSNSTRPPHGNTFGGTPPLVRRLSQQGLYGRRSPTLLPLQQHGRLGSARAYNGRLLPRSMNASPTRTRVLLQNKVHAARQQQHIHRQSDESSSMELGYGLGRAPHSARSSRSSTNNSIALRSGRSSPMLRASPMATNSVNSVTTTALTTGLPAPPPPSVDSRNSQTASLASHNKPDAVALTQALNYYSTMHGGGRYRHQQPRSPSPRPLPLMPLSASNPRRPLASSPIQRSATSGRIKAPPPPSRSPLFSLTRQASFQNEGELNINADKENKSVFVSDLSSVSEHRILLSPYKLRDRCDVCHNKYVIQ